MATALAEPERVLRDGALLRPTAWRPLVSGYEFDAANELKDLSFDYARAYPVRSEKHAGKSLMVYFAAPVPGPRLQDAKAIVGLNIGGAMCLYAFFACHDADGSPCVGFIYDRPNRKVQRHDWGIKSTLLDRAFLRPVAGAIVAYNNSEFFHGSISPDNLYWSQSGEIVLGPALLAPAGYPQSPIFDDPYRALCIREGRGPGDSSIDIYSLGLTLYALASGRIPGDEQPLADDLRRRISHGTLSSAINLAKAPSSYIHLLQGMVDDLPSSRWSPEQVLGWTNGRRPDVTAARKVTRPVPPVAIGKTSAYTAKELAFLALTEREDVAEAVISGSISHWVGQSLDREVSIPKITTKKGDEMEAGVARLAIGLDPRSPIRFKSLTFLPPSIGSLLLLGATNARVREEICELAATGLTTLWIGANPGSVQTPAEYEHLVNMRAHLGAHNENYERALYAVNPDAPCLSQTAYGLVVTTPESVADIAEDILGDADRTPDPHLTGFVLARASLLMSDVESLRGTFADAEAALTSLRAFAEVQRKAGGKPMPLVAARLAKAAEAVIDTFRLPDRREALSNSVNDAIASGDIARMASLVGDKALHATDEAEWSLAKARHDGLVLRVSNTGPLTIERMAQSHFRSAVYTTMANGFLMAAAFCTSLAALRALGAI